MDTEVSEVAEVTTSPDNSMHEVQKIVRERIEHLMKIFPRMSRSMIQVVLGTSLPGSLWHPILDQMIEEGVCRRVLEHHPSPNGRNQSYQIFELVKKD